MKGTLRINLEPVPPASVLNAHVTRGLDAGLIRGIAALIVLLILLLEDHGLIHESPVLVCERFPEL
jgi:hypothetical protein